MSTCMCIDVCIDVHTKVPELLLAMAAVIYGVGLVRMIQNSMNLFKASDEMRNKQIVACHKTGSPGTRGPSTKQCRH